MNVLPKLLLIISLARWISGLNLESTAKLIGDAKPSADKVSVNNKISKLRLILLGDLKPNEISIDSCWASSQPIKITAKSCPCAEINCLAPTTDAKRRLISASCMQICCGNRKRASIRSVTLDQAQIRELRRFSLEENCRRSNGTGAFVFAKIYERYNDKSICSGVLVHQKFLVTTAICVLNKRASDLVIKFGSDQKDDVKEIIYHSNFFRSIQTLQDNIALLMLEGEIYNSEFPCITKSNVDNSKCHVFSWGNSKVNENYMKVDNVEVLSKGECYTSHLISSLITGKRHEKYVNKGVNNICVGNANRYELDINSSGAALMCHHKTSPSLTVLKGLLTWSTKINFYPHIFTDVTQFGDWIEQTINEKYLNAV